MTPFRIPFRALLLLFCTLAAIAPSLCAQSGVGGEISWALGYDPKTFDPAMADEQVSVLLRYLTGGVLLRLNRATQQVEPALAESWTLSPDGRLLNFHLRRGLRFSDGSPLSAADVVATMRRVLARNTGAPVAEEFILPEKVSVSAPDSLTVRMQLPQRVVSIASVFDEIAIEPANHPSEGRVTSGAFYVAEYHPGESLHLLRNPFYFKHDAAGVALPYLSGLRLEMVGNREAEELRFARGQYHLLQDVPAEGFDALSRRAPGAVRDLGPSLNTEQMWFNQSSSAPLPAWEKAWFSNSAFRNAVSEAIHRADLVRIAYNGHATPANGFVSPANSQWYNRALQPPHDDPGAAMRHLAAAGFHKQGSVLVDRDGHPVRFSLLTDTDNRARERMATLIQQDLAVFGMQVNVVKLDFPALIDRLMHSGDYEAVLLGLANMQQDPSAMTNIWLSSSPNHQWNPSEKTPATPWEADLDRLVRLQSETPDPMLRKAAVDRMQAIVAEQQPFIYLVYPNVLCAVSPALDGVRLTVLQPDVVSTIDRVRLKGNR